MKHHGTIKVETSQGRLLTIKVEYNGSHKNLMAQEQEEVFSKLINELHDAVRHLPYHGSIDVRDIHIS